MMSFIKTTALSLGFDACGIARADELTDDAQFLKSWLEKGMHAEMGYLERNFDKRTDPRKLVPGCKSVVVVLMNYFPVQKQNADAPQIANYAYSEIDYHFILKEKLLELELQISAEFGEDCFADDFQHLFVDSAPVLERRWAERAGLGWIGKHTQLINPLLGSTTFIGVLMLNVETAYDSPIKPRCGNCTRCIDACPTQALKDGSLDARKCISYLTIENKNEIPTEFHSKLSNCVVGCDICADVCPWNNKKAHYSGSTSLKSHTEWLQWNREDWYGLTEDKFNAVFRKSAIKRAGYSKIIQTLRTLKSE